MLEHRGRFLVFFRRAVEGGRRKSTCKFYREHRGRFLVCFSLDFRPGQIAAFKTEYDYDDKGTQGLFLEHRAQFLVCTGHLKK